MKNTAALTPNEVDVLPTSYIAHERTTSISRNARSSAPATSLIDAKSNESAYTVKDWRPEEQPRERLMKNGPQALSTSELIAILLRTGTKSSNACDVARELLRSVDGKLRVLGTQDWKALAAIHGVGRVKAATLLAALELGRRSHMEADIALPLVQSSSAAYKLLAPQMRDLQREECWIILLNNACRCIKMQCLSIGGIDSTVVDVRAVMGLALRYHATMMVIAHNHPSKNLTPSHHDNELTKSLAAAGRLMKIKLMDHLIVAGDRYYSYADSDRL